MHLNHKDYLSAIRIALLIIYLKEVIRPQVPLRPPCYDFSPLAGPRFDPIRRTGPHLGPARVERRAVCARSRDVFTARW